MLYLHPKHHHAVEGILQFLLQCLVLIGVVSVAKQSCCGYLLVCIFNDADMPESDDTTEESGVPFTMHFVLVNHAKGCLVVPTDGIHLMACDGTMEIETAIVIDKAERYCIRIIVVSQQCERARGGTLKNADALLHGELLPLSAHGSEIAHHDIVLCLVTEITQKVN